MGASGLILGQSDENGQSASESTEPRLRINCIDQVRGIVMVLMALDHVKGNFSNIHFDATDLAATTPAYFMTRWITHFCAPTFVFLTGTGAFLHGLRSGTKLDLARFLVSRGLWLIFLEFTAVRFSWFLNIDYAFSVGQVIWAIGCSMVALSCLVFLPVWLVTGFGMAMIVLHNLFDGVSSGDLGRFDWLWKVMHTGESIEIWPGHVVLPMYPLVPWIGVMAIGYGFGEIMLLRPSRRRRVLIGIGVLLTVAFIALRSNNRYGDKVSADANRAGPWSEQQSALFTFFSFVNCQKYPPSLCFLLMTLGPAVTALGILDRVPGPIAQIFAWFGRVPLFFYLLHFYLIKGLSVVFAFVRYGRADWLVGTVRSEPPPDNGYELWVVYLVWVIVLLILFPLCRWFAGVKRRNRSRWLSYR